MTRLGDFLARVPTITAGNAHPAVAKRITQAREAFRAMIASDLNVPGALGVMFELVRDMNSAIDRGEVGLPDAELIRQTFEGFDQVLGVLALRRAEDAAPPVASDEIDRLIEERREARKARNFARADQIRQELESRGIILEDSAAGTRWKRK